MQHRKELENLLNERLANKKKVQILEIEIKALKEQIGAVLEPVSAEVVSGLEMENKGLEVVLDLLRNKIAPAITATNDGKRFKA